MNKLNKIRRLFWVCLGVWLVLFACKLLVVDGLRIAAHLYAQQHFDVFVGYIAETQYHFFFLVPLFALSAALPVLAVGAQFDAPKQLLLVLWSAGILLNAAIVGLGAAIVMFFKGTTDLVLYSYWEWFTGNPSDLLALEMPFALAIALTLGHPKALPEDEKPGGSGEIPEPPPY